MAKQVDETKIERIRDAALSIVVREGIRNASVASIAQEAGVSAGYLYRFYSGKDALINDLLAINFDIINDRISELLAADKPLREIIREIVTSIISNSEGNHEKIKFINMLVNDLSLSSDHTLSARIENLAEELLIIARKDPMVRDRIEKEDLYVALIGIPMLYLMVYYSGIVHGDKPSAPDADRIAQISVNILFKDNTNAN